MAKCDEGYLCQVCGKEVKGILQSDLYLRFVIGLVDPETLHLQPERHIKCNPGLAQFIDRPEFMDLEVQVGFRKQDLDEVFVRQKTDLVTRGFERLREVNQLEIAIEDYPLPDVDKR